MKNRSVILWLVLISSLLIPSKLFAYYYVCIDPGHGGSHHGSTGPIYGVREQDANLTVGLALRDKIQVYVYPVLMIRTTDETVDNDVRAAMANNANGGSGVNYFISVHHNGWPDTSRNGTETYYCNTEYTDSGDWRDPDWMYGARDSTFAKKVRLTLRDSLQHTYRCSRQILCGDTTQPCCMVCYDVLRLTTMQSTLSEASFLTNPWVEYQFYHNTDYIDKEAGAICKGWWSTYRQGGIAIIKNAYSTGSNCGYEGIVGIGDELWSIDTFPSPYQACWLEWEWHCLEAFTPQYINGYWYTFHHWTHLSPSGEPFEDYYDSVWCFGVPLEIDYHRYVAYFSGGPYSAQVVSPNGWETWYVAEQETIKWNVSIGADSTTWVYVYLDRNGGNGGYPQYLGGQEAKWGNFFPWTVTGPVSAHCKIKIVAEDVAGNSAWDVSNNDFSITGTGNNSPVIDSRLHCKYPYEECNECIKYGESFTLEVDAHDPDADSIYYEWYCMWGHFPNGQNTMTTAENYVEYFAPAKAEDGQPKQVDIFLKVTVVDIRGGSNDTSGYLGIYDQGTSCICGDANGSGDVELNDAVYIMNYLFIGGPCPNPIEKADPNNDCVGANLADAAYITNWLFYGGPPSVCCWIRPPEKSAESF